MEKDFDTWNSRKKEIHAKNFSEFIHEREVWWCSLGVNIGFEQDGKHEFFERPVLIIKKFNKDQVLAVPITSQVKENIYHVSFVHEDERFAAVISQVRVVSTKRMRRMMYLISSSTFELIRRALRQMI